MATLSVWRFPDEEGAQVALDKLSGMARRQLIQLQDAAVVSWPVGTRKPRTSNHGSLTGLGAVSGAFWGMLFGLIFFVPFFGMAVGAAVGALSGKFADYGINDKFIQDVREQVTEGTSALFLLTDNAVIDRVAQEFEGMSMELMYSNLSSDEEARLIEDFGG